jgi:molecular chaperone DnaK
LERVAAFFGKTPNRGVNPDEAVALGAAVQAAVLSGDHTDMLLLDVTPLSLGVETRGGLFTKLIERNTTIPTRAKQTFSTAVDNQTAIEVHILQGERELVADNRSLGRFELSGLPLKPRAHCKIEVSFEIDANGIVSVSATETETGKVAQVRISDAGGMNDSEVDRLLDAAKKAEKADGERRGLIERSNSLESGALQLRERLDEGASVLSEIIVGGAEAAISTALTALRTEIVDDARYLELNAALLDAATLVEDEILGAAAKARREAAEKKASEPEIV